MRRLAPLLLLLSPLLQAAEAPLPGVVGDMAQQGGPRVVAPAEPSHFWLDFGIGGGFGEREMSLASGGYSLRWNQGVHAVTLQRQRHLDWGRTGNNLFGCLYSMACANAGLSTVEETGLLYGRVTRTSHGLRILSGGPVRTIMRNFDGFGDHRDTYGLRLEMSSYRVFGGAFALSSNLFVNLNKENSFMGATASLGLGTFD